MSASTGQVSSVLVWSLVCTALVFAMQAGFCCLETGLSRTKHSTNVALKKLVGFCVSAVVFWAFGYGLTFGATSGGFVGLGDFMPSESTSLGEPGFFIFQLMFCATSASIISGAVAERMKFSAYVTLPVVASGILYPFVAHWAWAGADTGLHTGWLASLGFIDFAGGTVVHSVGGWIALAAAIVIGPRSGRFDGTWNEAGRSSIPTALLGTMLLWLGWFGFNGGSVYAQLDIAPLVVANTALAGAGGVLASLAGSRTRTGTIDPVLLMNGALGGLVSITPSAACTTHGAALIVGAVGGALSIAAMKLVERLKVDDVAGAVSVHGFCGAWGTLSVAALGNSSDFANGMDRVSQFGVQTLGAGVVFAWSFGGAFLLLTLVNRFLPLRASADAELRGLDIVEHGSGAELTQLIAGLRDEVDRYSAALRATNEGLWDWDLGTGTVHYSPRWREILGVGDDELENSPNDWFVRMHPDDRGTVQGALDGLLDGSSAQFQNRHRLLHADGDFHWVDVRAAAVRDERGKIRRVVGMLVDVTHEKEVDDELLHEALRDPLSGLFNRRYFMNRLGYEILRSKRHGTPLSLAIGDLDKFKDINDTHGHAIGDKVLVAVGELLDSLRAQDIAARIGGDEFAVLLPHTSGEEARVVIERVRRELAEHVFETHDGDFRVGSTFGIAEFDPDVMEEQELMEAADRALYHAKELGRGQTVVAERATPTMEAM